MYWKVNNLQKRITKTKTRQKQWQWQCTFQQNSFSIIFLISWRMMKHPCCIIFISKSLKASVIVINIKKNPPGMRQTVQWSPNLDVGLVILSNIVVQGEQEDKGKEEAKTVRREIKSWILLLTFFFFTWTESATRHGCQSSWAPQSMAGWSLLTGQDPHRCSSPPTWTELQNVTIVAGISV